MTTKYLILGGGLAGLSAAYHLRSHGCEDMMILEASERVGGLCKSVTYDDGFTFDQSIHILYSADKYATKLIKKLLHGNLSIQKRESWVFSSGVFTPYPWQANTYGLPVNIVRECLAGVIKATYENKGRESANFKAWCFNTFGEGFAKHFMVPYNSKLWAVALEEMTDAWIKDRVLTPELKDVIDGALEARDKDFGPNAFFWYPERGGIEALPRAFLPHIDADRIACETRAVKILWEEKKVLTKDGREWGYDKLISTLPLPVLNSIMDPSPPEEVTNAAGSLRHNRVYAINLAVKRENISSYHWIYYPEEKYVFHRINFQNNFSPNMVPEGWSSITIEVSASRTRHVPVGDTLVKSVVEGLVEAGVLKESDHVETKSILILNPAYVIYNHTHRSDVDTMHAFLKGRDIFPCGRFGDWEYLNMDHSILSGRRAAKEASSAD